MGTLACWAWSCTPKAKVCQLTDPTLGTLGRIIVVEVVFSEFLIGLAPGDDVIDDHEQRIGQCHDHFHVATPQRPFCCWRASSH
jgi:hypothetical protein